jgi:hypothetical protein
MIWILAVITTVSIGAPNVSINKIGVFPDEKKCEETRRALQENAEPGHLYICVRYEKDSPPSG